MGIIYSTKGEKRLSKYAEYNYLEIYNESVLGAQSIEEKIEELPVSIQEALDTIRVIGNNAVHPGEINLNDNKDTAAALFNTINIIVYVMISQPNKIKELYEKLPEKALKAIEKRDLS